MAGKRFLKMAAAVVLSLAVVFSASAGAIPAKADTLTSLQQKQASLQQKSKALDAQIQKLKGDKEQQQQYKDALEAQIDNVSQQISSKNTLINQLDADILQKQDAIAGKQTEINSNFEKLKQRVYALYLTGEASDIEIILNAKNIMDLADKAEFLQVISKHDTALINTLKSDMDSIATQKAAIEQSKKTVSDTKASLEDDQKKVQGLSDETQKVIDSINKNQKAAEVDKSATDEEEKAASDAVDKWFADYYAAQAKQKQEQKSTDNTQGNSRSSTQGGSGAESQPGTGIFMWPVRNWRNGAVTVYSRGFQPNHSLPEYHLGVDFSNGATRGLPIVAADSGTVTYEISGFGDGYRHCRDGGGYGNHVFIDHGNGFSTVYGHMEDVDAAISVGKHVTKGQLLGHVGTSGDSDGPHCHFEIRKNGVAVNPLNYLG